MASQMSQLTRSSESPAGDQTDDVTPELLELLGDEYTRRVLEAVTQQPRSGRDVMDAADVSKATAYRRLGDLEDAGLVESETVFDPDGHHHEQFRAVVESIDIEFGSDGLGVTIETETQPVADPPGSQLVADD